MSPFHLTSLEGPAPSGPVRAGNLEAADDTEVVPPGERHGNERAFAFSLMEVVVAVAVFAGTIVAVIGLLGPTMQTTREVIDSAVAARLADGVDQELKRFVAATSFATLQTATSTGGEVVIYAIADGSYLVEESAANNNPLTGNPRGIAAPDRYFRIAVAQLDAPLSSGEFVALSIRAEWPHRLPDGSLDGVEVPSAERKWFTFNTAIRP